MTPEPEDLHDEDASDLLDLVDERLHGLFSEDEEELHRNTRGLLDAAREDDDVADSLCDLLEASLQHRNDDSAATLMAAIILGEVASRRAIPLLLRGLSAEDDEELRDASMVALLRMGAPALLEAMEAVEEDDYPALNRPAYELLGQVGALEDLRLIQQVADFLESRIGLERRKPRGESAIEDLAGAIARIGDRRQIPALRQALAQDFQGRNTRILDACEALEENQGGAPYVPRLAPWEERYGWLFQGGSSSEERTRASLRRSRGLGGDVHAGPGAPDEDEDSIEADERTRLRRDLAFLFWGMSGTAAAREDDDDAFDARDHLSPPAPSGRDELEAEPSEDE